MSSGVEKRPSGMVERNFARISGVPLPMKLDNSGVSPATGHTRVHADTRRGQFHRMVLVRGG